MWERMSGRRQYIRNCKRNDSAWKSIAIHDTVPLNQNKQKNSRVIHFPFAKCDDVARLNRNRSRRYVKGRRLKLLPTPCIHSFGAPNRIYRVLCSLAASAGASQAWHS
jgi:hypothetical protein